MTLNISNVNIINSLNNEYDYYCCEDYNAFSMHVTHIRYINRFCFAHYKSITLALQ